MAIISVRIPEFIGSLTSLTYLNLALSPFSVSIPRQLGNLTSLSFLEIGSMYPITVSDFWWISRLSSLQNLTMTSISFTTTSDWLQSIKTNPSLVGLNMRSCQFSEVDTSVFSHIISSSNTLKSIDMSSNTIHPTAIPWLLNISSNLVDILPCIPIK